MTEAEQAVILAAIFLRNALIPGTIRDEERIRRVEMLLVFAVGELPQCEADLAPAADGIFHDEPPPLPHRDLA